MAKWQLANCIGSFFLLGKAVKLSPSDKDDILVDVVFDAVVKLVGKPKEESKWACYQRT